MNNAPYNKSTYSKITYHDRRDIPVSDKRTAYDMKLNAEFCIPCNPVEIYTHTGHANDMRTKYDLEMQKRLCPKCPKH